jgi:hypothetical protein
MRRERWERWRGMDDYILTVGGDVEGAMVGDREGAKVRDMKRSEVRDMEGAR